MMAAARRPPVDGHEADGPEGSGRKPPRGQFPLQLRLADSDHQREGSETKGAGNTVSIEPYRLHKYSEWSDADFDLEDLVLPAEPQWHRCGAVHCIDRGPWLGTLVCCIRRSGHDDGHSMSLGDEGAPDYWRETWL